MLTQFTDITKPECEVREYHVLRRTVERPSSVVWYFDCPWCGTEIKAYLWSLSGGGKRCGCGAIFAARGQGYKLANPIAGNARDATQASNAPVNDGGNLNNG